MCRFQQVAYSCICFAVALVVCQQADGNTNTQMKCEVVNKNCRARVGCGMALHNFMLGCNTVISGETNNCTAQCTRALFALFSTEDNIGQSLLTCDCNGDTYCNSINNRVNVCAKSVVDAMQSIKHSSSVVSCDLARWLCEADSHCQTAFTYYLNHCQELYNGQKCTKNCNASLIILHRQSKAAKLRNCKCEGQECKDVQRSTQRLCFNNNSGYAIKIKLQASAGARNCKHVFIKALLVYVVIYIGNMC